VYIWVHMAALTNQHPSVGVSGQSSASHHLYLIQSSFGDISQYVGATVDWIIRIAHLICDPLGTDGHIFTHTRGMSAEWYNHDRTLDW
jgi:hypothetical protein